MDRNRDKLPSDNQLSPWQNRLHEIIFEADTWSGRLFDLVLFALIGISVVAAMTESVIGEKPWLKAIEWLLTIIFTIEYILRILCVGRPWRYVFSFFGIVDLLAILPTYFALFYPTAGSLTVIRAIRLLRIFRVLKLAQYLTEANALFVSMRRTGTKITVFFAVVMIVVLILGATMYVIEGQQPNTTFSSIPMGVYWAIVTVTTVGYGDIAPQTALGQAFAALAMIIGYSIIVVPTGIFSAELIASTHAARISTQACPQCSREGHDIDADFCKFCGARL